MSKKDNILDPKVKVPSPIPYSYIAIQWAFAIFTATPWSLLGFFYYQPDGSPSGALQASLFVFGPLVASWLLGHVLITMLHGYLCAKGVFRFIIVATIVNPAFHKLWEHLTDKLTDEYMKDFMTDENFRNAEILKNQSAFMRSLKQTGLDDDEQQEDSST